MAATLKHVDGLAELDRLLKQLPVDIEVNILRGGLRAGQKVVATAAQSRAPTKSGELRRSIKVRTNNRAKRRGFARVDVVAGGKMAWYARLVHDGTGSHYAGRGTRSVRKPYVIAARDAQGDEVNTRTKRSLSRRGDASALAFSGVVRTAVVHPGIRPNPFMAQAADQLDGPALAAFVDYVRRRLPREMAKYQKSMGAK